MNVQEIMTSVPTACSLTDTAHDAAHIMWERDCGVVPVVDHDGHVVGVVTDRDIAMAAYLQGTALAAIPIGRIMSSEPQTCLPTDDLTHAERVMREHQVHRLPVIDERGILVGMLSLSDVARGVRSGNGRAKPNESLELLQTIVAISEPRSGARSS
jgi:CBS domain-containing protein